MQVQISLYKLINHNINIKLELVNISSKGTQQAFIYSTPLPLAAFGHLRTYVQRCCDYINSIN